MLCEVIDLIYQGERVEDVLLSRVSGAMARGKKLDFRSFILHVIQLLESEFRFINDRVHERRFLEDDSVDAEGFFA